MLGERHPGGEPWQWLRPLGVADLVRSDPYLPSRVVENLFWFGRYGERADAAMRLLRVAIEDNAGGARLLARGQGFELDMKVTRPVGHQTLNIALPLSDGFQFTSKQAALPAEGEVRVGRRVFRFAGDDALACLDYGRGVWPYRTEWNWAAAHGRVGAHMLGLNLGGRWTDFGGVTENGLVVDGVLHKLEERVVFSHDGDDVRRPWRIHGPGVAVT